MLNDDIMLNNKTKEWELFKELLRTSVNRANHVINEEEKQEMLKKEAKKGKLRLYRPEEGTK